MEEDLKNFTVKSLLICDSDYSFFLLLSQTGLRMYADSCVFNEVGSLHLPENHVA